MNQGQNKKRFAIILAIIGAGVFILGVLFFSGKLGSNQTASTVPEGTIVVWGTLPEDSFSQALQFIANNQTKIGVNYSYVSANTLKAKLSEAIASDVGPDMVISDMATFYSIKQYTEAMPYTTYPEAGFRQSFSNITYDLLQPSGILAMPIGIDPIVMFYNREILASSGYSMPPNTWANIYEMAPDVIKIDKGQIVRQELVPFGQYKNVNNAWAIISTLFMQSRIPIAKNDEMVGKAVNLNSSDISGSGDAGQKVLEFYTQFSDPKSQFYTWNRSMLDSKKEFLEGRLAFLPSFASEAKDISNRNPNLNFAVSGIPQLNTDVKYQATFANVYVASVLKKSTNKPVAYAIWFTFIEPDFQKVFAQTAMMAPALNSLLMLPPETTYLPVVYKSALIAKSWYNDDMAKTDQAFSQMIESVISGRQTIQQAIYQAESILKGDNF